MIAHFEQSLSNYFHKMCDFLNNEDKICWQKIKKNGHFRNKKKQLLITKSKLNNTILSEFENDLNAAPKRVKRDSSSIGNSFSVFDVDENHINIMQEEIKNKYCSSVIDNAENSNITDLETDIRMLALDDMIKHSTLNKLLQIFKKHIPDCELPSDARTLLRTPRNVKVHKNGDGNYWHYGLEKALTNVLSSVNINQISISINIDGLPMFKSSSMSFWPILVNIHECSHIPPLVIGIYN